MKNIVVSITLIIGVYQIAPAQSIHSDGSQSFISVTEKASALLDEYITYNEVVGISAGVSRYNKKIWSDASGYLDLENKIEANDQMLNRTASIAKPMTAVAILQLYERGKLDLDVPIQKYLPDFPLKMKGDITTRQLLHHTSGITAYLSDSEAFSTSNYPSLSDAIDYFKKRPLAFKPGEDYMYTTYGYVVLGGIIEKVSGKKFRDYMKVNIWQKCGMTHTDVEIFGETYPNKSKLYRRTSNGQLEPDLETNLSVKVPGGGFYTTVDDLLRFGNAILEGSLIKPETFEMMIQHPGIKKRGNPYAMGWFLYGDENSTFGRVIGHSGSQAGTSTQLMIYLDKKMVICALANTSGAWNDVIGFTDKLDNVVLEEEVMKQPLKKPITLSRNEMDKYTGKFELSNDRVLDIFRDGDKLKARFEGQRPIDVYPEGRHKFFTRAFSIEAEYKFNEKNEITHLVLKENGNTSEHKKLKNGKSVARMLYNKILEGNVKEAKAWFKKVHEKDEWYLDKSEMNAIAYQLVDNGKILEAHEVLKLNVASFWGNKPLEEQRINGIGYDLLSQNQTDQALYFFKLNVLVFPESWNTYDSLGEAYLKLGNNEKALENYKKSVLLNPDNAAAKAVIERLTFK